MRSRDSDVRYFWLVGGVVSRRKDGLFFGLPGTKFVHWISDKQIWLLSTKLDRPALRLFKHRFIRNYSGISVTQESVFSLDEPNRVPFDILCRFRILAHVCHSSNLLDLIYSYIKNKDLHSIHFFSNSCIWWIWHTGSYICRATSI